MITRDEMKQMKQWLGWKIIVKKDKKVKIPINPHNGRYAKTSDATTWGTINQAWLAKKKYNLEGIGFVFVKGCGIVGVDLDDCFDGPHLKPEPMQVVQMLNSYTEFSPSGRGLHIYCQGDIPSAVKTGNFEMYDDRRYFTITGDEFGISEFVSSQIEERQMELMALWVTYGEGYVDKKPARLAPGKYTRDPDIAEVRRALSFIPSKQDYDDWLRCVAGVYSAYPDQRGIDLIEEWSDCYPGEVETKFKSFGKGHTNPASLRTVFFLAIQHGYTVPPSGDRL